MKTSEPRTFSLDLAEGLAVGEVVGLTLPGARLR